MNIRYVNTRNNEERCYSEVVSMVEFYTTW